MPEADRNARSVRRATRGEQGHDVHFDGPPLAQRVDTLVRLALDVDPTPVALQQTGDVINHLSAMFAQPGTFTDDGDIEVAHFVPRLSHPMGGDLHENRRVGVLILWIGIGKEATYVLGPDRPQQGVGESVVQRVTIGMSHRPERMIEPHPAEDERPAGTVGSDRLQAMQVVAVADAEWEISRVEHGTSLSQQPGRPRGILSGICAGGPIL